MKAARVRFFVCLILLILTGCLLDNNVLALTAVADPPPTLSVPVTLVVPPTETPTPAPPTHTPTPLPPPPTPIAGAVGPYTYADNVNPLTGLTVDDPAALNHRPIVTKISNAPPLVRPQSGIGAADIVFEHYAEGGLTRFSAVFYSQLPERVGSIRSARLIDYELVPMYQALLAYSGGSNGINALYAGSDFHELTYMGVFYGQPYYWRDEDIPVPHNLFSNLAAISRLASEEGLNDRPALDGMAFLDALPGGEVGDANLIDIRYVATLARWAYDPADGVYRRFSDGQPHVDATTEQQISAENVVILYADHIVSDIAESEWQGRVTYGWQIRLWFEGDAILFRDGKQYEGRWVRPTREDMLQLRTDSGDLLYLKPGRTFFQVVRLPEQQDPAEEGLTVQ